MRDKNTKTSTFNRRSELSRSRAIDTRKRLVDEYRDRKRQTQFVDRRIGDKDPNTTQEDIMFKRFTKEKMNAYQRKLKKNRFSLADGEGLGSLSSLTHRGRLLGIDSEEEVSDFDDISDSEVGAISKETVLKSHFGGGERKSKRQIMSELISKSKKFKAERQRIRSENEDLRMQLNEDFDDIREFLSFSTQIESASGPQGTYDDLVLSLSRETKRAKATDRLKSIEEIALGEISKLHRLEVERLARMNESLVHEEDLNNHIGSVGIQRRSSRKTELDLLAENHFSLKTEESDSDSQAYDSGEGLSDGISIEEEEYPELTDGDSEFDRDSQDGESSDTSFSENPHDAEIFLPVIDAEPPVVSLLLESVPFVFEMPRSFSEWLSLIAGYSKENIVLIIDRMCVLYSKAANTSFKMNLGSLLPRTSSPLEHFALLLVDYSLKLVEKDQDTDFLENIFDRIETILRDCARIDGTAVFFVSKLSILTDPESQASILLLLIIERLFSISDKRHAVVTPCLIRLGQLISTSSNPTGLLRTLAISVRWTLPFKRVMPETVSFMTRISNEMSISLPCISNVHSSSKKFSCSLEELPRGLFLSQEWLSREHVCWILHEIQNMAVKYFEEENQVTKWGISIVFEPLFPCLFSTFLKPLALQSFKPEPLKMLSPLLHNRRRDEENVLRRKYKSEFKGTVKDLRQDSRVLALYNHNQMLKKRKISTALQGKEFRLA